MHLDLDLLVFLAFWKSVLDIRIPFSRGDAALLQPGKFHEFWGLGKYYILPGEILGTTGVSTGYPDD